MSLAKAMEEPEKRILLAALKANGWNRQLTASILEINRTTLYKKMKRLGLEIDELASPELTQILTRAQERLEQAILFVYTGQKAADDIEIPSFPVAIMLALATKNSFIKKRYALAEAKQAHLDFQGEPAKRLMAIALDFDWNIAPNTESGIPSDYFSSVQRHENSKNQLLCA